MKTETPRCEDCKHVQITNDDDGKPWVGCSYGMFLDSLCNAEMCRVSPRACGPEARFFQPPSQYAHEDETEEPAPPVTQAMPRKANPE